MATKYNIYWDTSPGVTKGSTKIADVSSPYVHGPLSNFVPHYYAMEREEDFGVSVLSTEVFATPDVGGYEDLMGITGTEGQELEIDTGAIYTWSDETDVRWIRKEAYDASGVSLGVVASVLGDTTSTPGYTQQIQNSGTITSDGTYLIQDCTTTFNAGANLNLTTPPSGGSYLWQGYFKVVSITAIDSAIYLRHENGLDAYDFKPHKTSAGYARLCDTVEGVIGTVNRDVYFIGQEHYVEIFSEYGVATSIFFDNESTPSLEATATELETTTYFASSNYCGNPQSPRDGKITTREHKFIRLT